MFQKAPAKPASKNIENSSREESPRKVPFGTNVILSDVEITGTVRFKNDVVIDGTIDGEIFSDGTVTIGSEATVKAGIRAKSVIVEGSVHGDIHASDRLELGPQAEVTGDIEAAILSMQAGAVLVGSSTVGSVPPTGKIDHQQQGRNNVRQVRELAIV